MNNKRKYTKEEVLKICEMIFKAVAMATVGRFGKHDLVNEYVKSQLEEVERLLTKIDDGYELTKLS